ncbi:ankyrin repeat-containing domain protein [Endogone sp. FLAS-F59071]|nr:ankyrin repeat-containing domain protein [Endogone sp. FLAS-F59071]|eukprot:RUS15162.1 ankyrin repeat-containing domain protein [Endogone sp. FLAS-F59071]
MNGSLAKRHIHQDNDRPAKRRDTEDSRNDFDNSPPHASTSIASLGPSPELEALESGGTDALWAAINLNAIDMKVLFSYMRSGSSINVCSPQGYGLLFLAARNKSMEALRLLMLQPDIKVSVRNGPHAESPLHAAAGANLVDAIELFLEHSAPVNAPNSEGHTPLYDATFSRALESMQMLLSADALPDSPDREGNTPLQIAASQDFLEGMKLLIEHGARVDHRNNSGLTPLANAINLCNLDAMHLLLQHGADVHARTRNGRTLLHHAVNWNRMEAVEALVAAGCEVNVSGATEEETPIYMAVQQSKIDVVQFLLEHGADPCRTGSPLSSSAGLEQGIVPREDVESSSDRIRSAAAAAAVIVVAEGEEEKEEGTKSMATTNLPLLYAANHGYYELCALLVTERTPDYMLQHAWRLATRANVGHETVSVLWKCLTARRERERRKEREKEEAERLAKEGPAVNGEIADALPAKGDDVLVEEDGVDQGEAMANGNEVMGLDFVLDTDQGEEVGLGEALSNVEIGNEVDVQVIGDDDDGVEGITPFGIELDPV